MARIKFLTVLVSVCCAASLMDAVSASAVPVPQDDLIVSGSDVSGDLPEIRSTFFGLRMGERAGKTEIMEAMEPYGEYLDAVEDESGVTFSFGNVLFDGIRWDICEISISPEGEFDFFSVYSSWPFEEDYEVDARNAFHEQKARLAAEYGEGETIAEGYEEYIIYEGAADVSLVLSCSGSESFGGEYRWYVQLAYGTMEI